MDNEKLESVKKELVATFSLLQRLDAPFNENNVAIVNGCLGSLKYSVSVLDELLKMKGDDEHGDDNA